MLRSLLACSAVLALAGCAYPNPAHVRELNALVGKPEADLIRTLGVPNRTYDTGGLRFVTYARSRIESFGDGFGPGFGYGGFGYGFGYGGFGYGGFGYDGLGPDIQQEDCNTTFELQGGIVKSYSLRGNDC